MKITGAFIAFVFSMFLCASISLAQSSIELKVDRPPRADAQNGYIQVVAFENGLPVAGLEFETTGLKRKTDSSGMASFEIRAGAHELYVPKLKKKFAYTAVENSQTQVIVNILGEDVVESEAKSGEKAEKLTDIADARGTFVQVKVQTSEGKQPLEDATIMVAGFSGTIKTNSQGVASFELPAGKHALSVFHEKHQTRTEPALDVGTETKIVSLALNRAADELDEYVVLAPKVQGSVSALVEIRRNATAVTDVLGSEQMARAGDSDAAASLRRVTGLTLIGGKYVYVRGLGERYSAVTLNGANIPSPEPSRRVVPLDLFPTAMLESVIVQKSATANLPGEFGGGLIQLKSRSIPDKPFVRISVSQSYEDTDGSLGYKGGSSDWAGIDDGTRKLPSSIRNALESGRPLKAKTGMQQDGFSPEELAAMARELKPIYNTEKREEQPVPNFNVAAGRRWDLNSFKLGTAASLLRTSSYGHTDRESMVVTLQNGETVPNVNSSTSLSEQEYKTGAALDLSLDFSKTQHVRTTAMLVRHTSNEIEVKDSSPAVGAGGSNFNRRRTTTLEWVERQLFVRQLSGEHALPADLKLDWRAQRAEATRSAPDTREFSFEDRFGFYELDTDSTGNSRTWNELYDVSDELGVQLSYPFKTPLGEAKVAVGGGYLERSRESNTFRFHLSDRGGAAACDPRNTNLEEGCFAPGNLKPDGFVLINQTLSADSYRGIQTTRSQYLTSTFELGKKWEMQAGARAEQGFQQVKSYYYDAPGTPSAFAGLKTDDVMPSYNLTWKLNPYWRARFAFSETLTRPEFREIAEVSYIDEETGIEGIGNPKLRGTVIRNYDHRWEYYPSPDETVSVGVFYKDFKSPIEDTFAIQSDGVRKTFENAKSARNRGIEFESRLALRRTSRYLRRWTLSNNVTLIDSKVELNPKEGSIIQSERSLQGQSPWVLNVQLQYDRPQKGTTFAIVYNVVGPRITEVGTFGYPDVYEQPFHQIDVTAQQKFRKSMTVGLLARNLLDPEVRSMQGAQEVRSFHRGRSFGVSLTAVY